METVITPKLKIHSVKIDKSQRLHGIDALRAIAMILGMLLHATIAYRVHALPNWPHDNSYNDQAFDFLYHFVHSFRMPLFFLIAGYFSRLLFHKLGEFGFIKHRFKRIVIPFIFSLVFILPISILPFSIYRFCALYPGQWNVIFKNSFKEIFHWNGLAHLWFLYYLVIYYITLITFFRVKKVLFKNKFPLKISIVIDFFHPASYAGILFFALIICSILMFSPELYLHVDTSIFPAPQYLLFYAMFFFMGWLINKSQNSFTWISDKFWLFIITGSALCLLLFLADFYKYPTESWKFLGIKLLAAFQIIFLVYGVIGFFLKYCQSQNSLWKYISDASYWMYLIHLGLIAGLQIYFINTSIPGIIRFPLVLIIPLVITLVTYHYFVRYTILGTYLHGFRDKNESQKKSIN